METIKLDLIPGKKMPSLHASQFDDGREHGVDLFENGVAYKLDGTETLTINERKGDDCICSLDIENTFTGSNHIVFASTEQMCAVWGNNICELVIAKGEKTLGTLNFILEIEPSPTEGGIESESEISNLERQITEITEQVIGDDYYTAEQTDEAIATATEGKADTTYVDTELDKKADKNNTYTKTEVDNSLNTKMNKANPTGTGSFSLNRKANTTVGEKSVAMGNNATASGENSMAIGNNSFAGGANSVAMGNGTRALGANQFVFGKLNSDNNYNNYVEIVGKGNTFTRSNARTLDWYGNETLAGDLIINGNQSVSSEISRLDGRIDNLPKPVIFKGTLGVGGTVTELPVASESVEGWEFKCITAGTYAGLTLKEGDTVTCFNPPNTSNYYWDKTGSQDTDTDTWRNIKVNGVEKLGNDISSGAVDFEDTENVKFEFDANGNKIKATFDGIYTDSEVDDLLDDKADADNTYTKAQVDDIVYGILPDDTASGSVANFNTSLELPIKSLEIDVNAVQEAGTPTPSTPKAISGWNAITLNANGNTEVINLGGTYYGGHFTQDKAGHRQFEVTHGIYTFDGTENFGALSSNNRVYTNVLSDAYIPSLSTEKCVISTHYVGTSQNQAASGTVYKTTGNSALVFQDDTNAVDVATFKAFLTNQYASNTPVTVAYKIATPFIIDLPDGEPIITLNGTNNIYADTGDSTVVFKCSVNDYVSAHSGGNLLGMGGVYLGGAKSGGSEEETDEGEDTEKTKLDDPKEEIKTIGDTKKLGGE